MITSLLAEINSALVVNNLEEVQPLRMELYGGTMIKDGESDLQAWISYLTQRAKRLEYLGKKVGEEELIAIFLKGLHPIFQPLQVHFAIPGACSDKWDKVVAIVRKFAATPVVAVELAKLKSSSSHTLFPAAIKETTLQSMVKKWNNI